MSEIQKNNSPRSYKEKFEFELTVDNNIICQRYFRINDSVTKELGHEQFREFGNNLINRFSSHNQVRTLKQESSETHP